MKTPPVNGLLLVRLAQWDTNEWPNVDPVPTQRWPVCNERQQVSENIVCEVRLDFLLQVPVP